MKVHKDFLPSMFFNKLNEILNGNNFQWYFQNSTLDEIEPINNFMFTHNLFNHQETSEWFKIFEPILYSINEKYKVNKLIRMKLNLYTNQHKKIIHGSHQDFPEEKGNVKIGILNFTNSNGGTTINKKHFKSNENELIVFDNNYKHNGFTQTDKPKRIILNIGWK